VFSDEVANRIQFYVYRLVDPRNGETFYVGKGKGNRLFQHVSRTVDFSDSDEDAEYAKYKRIKEIERTGLEVLHIVHRHGLKEDVALEVEAALIDAYPGLTNIAGGVGSGARGPMHSKEIMAVYDLPELVPNPDHKLILINTNKMQTDDYRGSIYDQVRYAWRINVQKAVQADYVIAVVRGVAKAVFVAERWLPATSEHFPEFLPTGGVWENRYGFVGQEASKDAMSFYVGTNGKRVSDPSMRHRQNPIRYFGF
jgi:uncharacterized protein